MSLLTSFVMMAHQLCEKSQANCVEKISQVHLITVVAK